MMSSSNDRLLSKLDQLIANENYYEAHQIYRTLYHRMLRSNRTQQLSVILYEGAIHLLRKAQYNSGADVACLYLDVIKCSNATLNATSTAHQSSQSSQSWQTSQSPQNTQILTNIHNLFELIPAKTPERLSFISKAIKLNCMPISAIHKQFAVVLWREKNFAESRSHFVHSCSTSGDECALMLVEYQTKLGFSSEVDLFIAQFVLQVLCIKNKTMADNTFHAYTSKHPNISSTSPPFLLPLLNFVWFLLVAIDSGKSATFKTLCELYGNSLKRDPSYNDYLTQIGQIYFGLEKVNRNRTGFFGNLLQSLIENGDSDDESLPTDRPTAGPSVRHNATQEVELD